MTKSCSKVMPTYSTLLDTVYHRGPHAQFARAYSLHVTEAKITRLFSRTIEALFNLLVSMASAEERELSI